MKKPILSIMILLFFWGSIFSGCSDRKDAKSEKSAIEKMTEETGKELADKLSSPIEKARKAAKQEEDRQNDMVNAANDEE